MVESTWLTREVPVLEAVAAAEEEGAEANGEWLSERTGLGGAATSKGVQALLRADPPYVTAIDASTFGSTYFMDVQLLERGRRTVGAWTNEEGGLDAFLDLLAERIDAEPDEAEKSRLTKLREAAQGLGKDVGTSLLTAWLKTVTGL